MAIAGPEMKIVKEFQDHDSGWALIDMMIYLREDVNIWLIPKFIKNAALSA